MPPAGFKRSRALWDETRRSHKTTWDAVTAWRDAILYELQPFRFSKSSQQQVLEVVRSIYRGTKIAIQNTPGFLRSIWRFLKSRTRQQWMIVAAIVAYYYLVRWMHEYVFSNETGLVFVWLLTFSTSDVSLEFWTLGP